MATKTVKVPKISCGHCTSTIEREVSDLEGITSVQADKDSKMVTIECNEPPATPQEWACMIGVSYETYEHVARRIGWKSASDIGLTIFSFKAANKALKLYPLQLGLKPTRIETLYFPTGC